MGVFVEASTEREDPFPTLIKSLFVVPVAIITVPVSVCPSPRRTTPEAVIVILPDTS